ncbi:agamous-like MADS-box protein AGL65 [Solanum tuberosum]|uniref:agamous-like MADS-box protein AGL65 n=1 Tax=Solanum tuberosum TaxID=4113 RepID=UPI00073A4C4A|nr:PREDICTED: agamous-like MADS-box protein AGL65 [Solanum tuberosum]
MVRQKVKLAFMENNTERRVSYRKRQKGFLTKARELNTLCDVELATLINSPYHNEPEVFPNHEATTGIFTKFIDLPEERKSKNMKTQEKITMKRIEKIENELENLINDGIKAKTHEEGSTSNALQPIAGPMDSGGTSFDMPWAPLLALVDAPILSEIPLLVPSTVPSGTNFKKPRAPLNLVLDVTPTSMVPLTAPLMALSRDPTQVPQLMFPLRTPPQMVPLVDL